MSVNGVSSSSHRIGILMCDEGRFVSCIDCHLCLGFPTGADYDTIAKQFESGRCCGPALPKDGAFSGTTGNPSEASNRFDFDHNANPMWVFDNSTLLCSAVNEAAVHDYGYSRKEFLSMTMLDIRPSEHTVPLLGEMLQKGNSAKNHQKHRKKDGSFIEVAVTCSEVLFNGCIADIVTAVDVTGHL
jgi:PAS domain S-box-containing protein